MRRTVSSLASLALLAGGLVVAGALATPAVADPTGTVPVVSGSSAYPDVPDLVVANDKDAVYATYDAAGNAQLWVQPLKNHAADGAAYALNDFSQYGIPDFTRPGTDGLRHVAENMTLAGTWLAGYGGQVTAFSATQNIFWVRDLSDPANHTKELQRSADGGFSQTPEQLVSAAPDGYLSVKTVPGATQDDPTTVHLFDNNATLGTANDLGALPDADPTLTAGSPPNTVKSLHINGAATTADGAVFGYPVTTTVSDGNTPPKQVAADNLIYVKFADTSTSTSTVLDSAPSGRYSQLMAGGGKAVWANYLISFTDPGCHAYTKSLNGTGVVRDYKLNPCGTVAGINGDTMLLTNFAASGGNYAGTPDQTWCPVTVGQCASGPLVSVALLDGTRSTSSSVYAVSAVSDGSQFYVAQGTTLGTAGIYSTTSATAAEKLVAASPARPLGAAQVALSTGQVTWTDGSTTSGPVRSSTITAGTDGLTLGTPKSVASASIQLNQVQGYGLATSGGRTAYSTAPSQTGKPDNLLVRGPDGKVTTVTTFADDSPSMQYLAVRPHPLQVSGANVLYLTSNPDTSVGGMIGNVYDTATGTTVSYPAAAAYALSGGYLAALNLDGSVTVTDIVKDTAPVVLRAKTVIPAGGEAGVTGQVTVAGGYVGWLAHECVEAANAFDPCGGVTEAGYRDIAKANPAAVLASAPSSPADDATPETPLGIAQSADYLLLDDSNVPGGFGSITARQLTAVKLADGTKTPVSTAYVSGVGKYDVHGSTVAWIDHTGTPEVAALDSTLDAPRLLTATSPVSFSQLSGPGAALEVAASSSLSTCSIAITQGDTTVRTLDCKSADGDGVATWDGKDADGHDVPQGIYTWTVTGSNATGPLQDYDGSASPITRQIAVLNFTDTTGSQFALDIAWLVQNGVTEGYKDGGFHPTVAVSRQAMAAFLYRYANPGQTAPACATQKFWDVPVDLSFCGAIQWLADQGITVGSIDAGHTLPGFHPRMAVSRQAMAAFMYRFQNPDQTAPKCTTQSFWDVPTSQQFCPQIGWLVANGVTQGYPDKGHSQPGYHPLVPVSRQAMAAFLHRLNTTFPPTPK